MCDVDGENEMKSGRLIRMFRGTMIADQEHFSLGKARKLNYMIVKKECRAEIFPIGTNTKVRIRC